MLQRHRAAIIDIGSNSIRLVVFEGPQRLPFVMFNEKVMAGLGRSLAESGRLDDRAIDLAVPALQRFAALSQEMGCDVVRTVATAAVRDAENAQSLISAAADVGLAVEVLSGAQEAMASGMGVLSAFPDADGVVGDLGGGSLELVRVCGGRVRGHVSFPLGVLRLAALRKKTRNAIARTVSEAVSSLDWAGEAAGLPFYLVGGSWRALARLDMAERAYPLPIIHGYALPHETVSRWTRVLPDMTKAMLRDVKGLSSSRIPHLSDAAELLSCLMRDLRSSHAIVSAFGLREGLLFERLPASLRDDDPLIAAVRDEGRREGRFPEHGDLLDRWIAPLFVDDDAACARLRLAACWLADVGWRANPEFRAERCVETALHGNWVGIDASGRAQMAQALHVALGGDLIPPPAVAALAGADRLDRASKWGLAIRLGQRLSGGMAGPLRRTRLSLSTGTDRGTLALHVQSEDARLWSAPVQRRHAAVAAALMCDPALSIDE